jgi:arsenate reductase
MPLTIFHNPRCSKSRQTLALLQEHEQSPEIIEYLKNPPSPEVIAEILQKLGLQPDDIMRTNESAYSESRDRIATMSRDEKLAWLAANPSVLQRPIVMSESQARIGRPPESVLEILNQ